MTIETRIIDGPIPAATTPPAPPGAGALLTFDGIVRALEDNRPLQALDYEAYQPMADRELHALAQRIAESHHLLALHVHHSRGRIPVGQCSLRVTIAAPHRAEALAAMAELIDTLKRDIPIWKKPVYKEPR